MKTKKRIAIYPGTFDPVTFGHLDILKRASSLFDEVIMAVVERPSKDTLFSLKERLDLLSESVRGEKFHCPVKVESFDGLLVHYARQRRASTIVRGLRATSDFDYEFQMALMNRHQEKNIETVLLMPDEKFVYLSSSLVKVVGRLKGNLQSFLPKPVVKALQKKFTSL